MRGGNPLDSNLKMEFPVIFCRTDSEEDNKSTITVCRFDEKIMKGGLTENRAACKFALQ